MVDPLDGTKEFIKRNGEFTVNIALIEQTPQQKELICSALKLLYFAEAKSRFKSFIRSFKKAPLNEFILK